MEHVDFNLNVLFIYFFRIPVEAKGDGDLMNALSIENTLTKEKKDLKVNGLFYAIGHVPNTTLLALEKGGKSQLEVDESGYIVVKAGTSLTSVEGVFAAGDVQDKRYRQAVTAAGYNL